MTGSDDAWATPDVPEGNCDSARIVAYRRSLRESRVRRATAALRRRRVLRSRRSMLAATAGLLIASGGGAVAATGGSDDGGGGLSANTITSVQRALGVAADGVVGPQTRRAVKRYQRGNGLIVDGVIGPQTLAALGIKTTAAGSAERINAAAVDGSVLERIAACESRGDPTAISADGQYRGKYQFSLATWKRMGGAGDPAQAAEAEQDRLAAKLLRLEGTDPWPNCA